MSLEPPGFIHGEVQPIQKKPALFAMNVDEPTIFFENDKLASPHAKQKAFLISIIGMFQSSMILLGKPDDSVALYSQFMTSEHQKTFDWLYQCFSSLKVPFLNLPMDKSRGRFRHNIEDKAKSLFWLVVLGNIEAFEKAKSKAIGENELLTSGIIAKMAEAYC